MYHPIQVLSNLSEVIVFLLEQNCYNYYNSSVHYCEEFFLICDHLLNQHL